MMRAGSRVTPGRPAVRPGRHLGGHDRHRRRGDRGRRRTAGSAPRPLVGHPTRRRGRAAGRARPTRRSRACGGSTCRSRFDEFAVVLIIQEEPDGYRHPQRLHPGLDGRPGRAARLAAGRRSTTPPAPGRPTGASITCTTARRQAGAARGRVAAAGADPRRRRVRRRPGLEPRQWKGAGFTERVTYDMTDPAVAGRVMFGVIDHVGRAVWREEGKEPPRAGGSSSTAPSAATTPAASPTGSPSHPAPGRTP